MNHRYDYDIRRGTRRRDTDYSGCGVVVVVLLMFSLLAGFCAVLAKQTNEGATAVPKKRHDSLGVVYTNDGTPMYEYVFTDPDSGLQYLICPGVGQCERMNRDGTQMGVTDR